MSKTIFWAGTLETIGPVGRTPQAEALTTQVTIALSRHKVTRSELDGAVRVDYYDNIGPGYVDVATIHMDNSRIGFGIYCIHLAQAEACLPKSKELLKFLGIGGETGVWKRSDLGHDEEAA